MNESSKGAGSARPDPKGRTARRIMSAILVRAAEMVRRPEPLREVAQANTRASDQPVVPASVTLPEITVKAVVLSVILAAVLAAANAYLGLFAGMTVSASIPAAVASMAILRLFKRSNILENNIVQTAA